MGHWLAIFCFGDADLCVCEESSVDNEGIRFGGIDWVFRLRSMTVEEFLEKDGGALQCRYRVEHDDIIVQTSKAELWHRCRTNPLNFTQYDMTSNNCQLWTSMLLVHGLG